jgi:hypothetical protein
MRIRTIPDSPSTPFENGAKSAPFSNGVDGGRDPSTGKFTAGNRHGVGNPYARKLARLKHSFMDAFTDELMGQFVQDLARLAGKGDMEAAKLLLAYGLGEPPAPADPDGVDVDELMRLKQVVRESTLGDGTKFLDAATAVTALRALIKSGLRRCLADGTLSKLAVRQDVQTALEAIGMADLLDESRNLRERLK